MTFLIRPSCDRAISFFVMVISLWRSQCLHPPQPSFHPRPGPCHLAVSSIFKSSGASVGLKSLLKEGWVPHVWRGVLSRMKAPSWVPKGAWRLPSPQCSFRGGFLARERMNETPLAGLQCFEADSLQQSRTQSAEEVIGLLLSLYDLACLVWGAQLLG